MFFATTSVKDDTGRYVVFTEQDASALHMMAAKVLYTLSRLPGMADDANAAVSAYTPDKMEDAASHIVEACRDGLSCDVDAATSSSTYQTLDEINDPVAPFARNLDGHPPSGLL